MDFRQIRSSGGGGGCRQFYGPRAASLHHAADAVGGDRGTREGVGTRLFERRARGVILTAEGQRALSQCTTGPRRDPGDAARPAGGRCETVEAWIAADLAAGTAERDREPADPARPADRMPLRGRAACRARPPAGGRKIRRRRQSDRTWRGARAKVQATGRRSARAGLSRGERAKGNGHAENSSRAAADRPNTLRMAAGSIAHSRPPPRQAACCRQDRQRQSRARLRRIRIRRLPYADQLSAARHRFRCGPRRAARAPHWIDLETCSDIDHCSKAQNPTAARSEKSSRGKASAASRRSCRRNPRCRSALWTSSRRR